MNEPAKWRAQPTWRVVRHGYEWKRIDYVGTIKWEVSWPIDKDYKSRQKCERYEPPEWVWAAWCASQLIDERNDDEQ